MSPGVDGGRNIGVPIGSARSWSKEISTAVTGGAARAGVAAVDGSAAAVGLAAEC